MKLSEDIAGMRSIKSGIYGTYLRLNRAPRRLEEIEMTAYSSARDCSWMIEVHDGKVVLSTKLEGRPPQYLGAYPNGYVFMSSTITEWETWTPVKNDDSSWSLQSAHGAFLRCNLEESVSTEETCDAWKSFWIEPLDKKKEENDDKSDHGVTQATNTENVAALPTTTMDFFALPDLFIRKVMKTLWIKDRLRVRLTCRAFEKIIAKTDAGYFEQGMIADPFVTRESSVCLFVGNEKLKESDEDGLESFVDFRHRLFNRITFGSFSIKLQRRLNMNFVHEVTRAFKIHKLIFEMKGNEGLNNALNIISWFPHTKHVLEFDYVEENDRIMSLPPLEKLRFSACCYFSQFTSHMLLQLLDKHSSLSAERIIVAEKEVWEKIIEIISSDSRERTVELRVLSEIVMDWLRSLGVSESTAAGNIIGEVGVDSTNSNMSVQQLSPANEENSLCKRSREHSAFTRSGENAPAESCANDS